MGIDGPLINDFPLPRSTFVQLPIKQHIKQPLLSWLFFLLSSSMYVSKTQSLIPITSSPSGVTTHHVNVTWSLGLQYPSIRLHVSRQYEPDRHIVNLHSLHILSNYFRGQSHRTVFIQSRGQHLHRLVRCRPHDWWTSHILFCDREHYCRVVKSYSAILLQVLRHICTHPLT
jgi:hypothetical protein